MYVTLEPCAHQGRQPPCAEAILEAGIARVVIASDDPSEKAAGRGPGILRDGGVEVELAAGAEAAGGAAAQPALPQARPHRAAAGDAEAGDVARRPHQHRARRLALDLRRAQAAPWSTAGAPNPTRSRSASAPSSPTTRCSPPAAAPAVSFARLAAQRTAGPAAAPSRRLRLPGPPAARLPAPRDPRPVPGPRRRRPGGGPSLASVPSRAAGAEILVAGGATETDRIASALADLGRRDITSLFLEGGRTLAAAFLAAGADRRGPNLRRPVLLGGSQGRRAAEAARETALSARASSSVRTC